MMRDSLIFYQSFAKAIKRLPEEDYRVGSGWNGPGRGRTLYGGV